MKNQKGFAPIVLVIVVVVVVAAVAGYLYMSKKGGGVLPSVALPGGVGLNPNCELKDPELCRFVDKSSKMTASIETGFTGRTVTTDKTGKKTESLWEMQGGNSHFQNSENGKEVSNMITLGDTTYTKDMADGKWFKYTFKKESSSSTQGLFNADEIKNSMKDAVKEIQDKTSYKALGKEQCGDLTCFKYEVMGTTVAGEQQFLYFDDREYLMRLMKTVDKDGTTNDTYFDYKPVTISAPSPVKQGEGFNLYDPSIIDKTAGSVSSVNIEQLKQDLLKNVQVPQDESSSAGE